MCAMSKVDQPQRRFTLWTLFYGVMGLIAALLLFASLLLSLWSYGQARRVDELVGQIRAKGEPVTGEEVEKHFALAADVDDVTQLWLDGIHSIDTAEQR